MALIRHISSLSCSAVSLLYSDANGHTDAFGNDIAWEGADMPKNVLQFVLISAHGKNLSRFTQFYSRIHRKKMSMRLPESHSRGLLLAVVSERKLWYLSRLSYLSKCDKQHMRSLRNAQILRCENMD